MSDIFSEIDEDLRRDRMKSLWKRHQWLILGLAAALVAAVGGWRGYTVWQASKADAEGDRYLAAIALADADKHAEAAAALEKLGAGATRGYRALSAMRSASELAASGKPGEAIGAFDAIAADTSLNPSLRDVARLRAAYVLVDTTPETVAAKLAGLIKPENPFRHSAQEAIGLAAYKKNDIPAAKASFAALADDPETPAPLRSRANLMLTLLAGDEAATAPEETKK